MVKSRRGHPRVQERCPNGRDNDLLFYFLPPLFRCSQSGKNSYSSLVSTPWLLLASRRTIGTRRTTPSSLQLLSFHLLPRPCWANGQEEVPPTTRRAPIRHLGLVKEQTTTINKTTTRVCWWHKYSIENPT